MNTHVIEAPTRVKLQPIIHPTLTGDQARRKANGYLTKHASMYFGAVNPIFLPLARPVWQLSVIFLRDQIGPVQLAFLDIDALSGEVIPFTADQIQELRSRAHAFVTCHTLPTTPSR